MPQQSSDWVTVNPQPSNDWQTINPSPAPVQAPPDESSLLEDWNNLWFNQPLSHKLTGGSLAPGASEWIDPVGGRTEDQWKIPSWVPFAGGGTWRSLLGGMGEGLVNVGESLTSPLNLATLGTAKGATSLGTSAAALRQAGKAAEAARKLELARRATIATRTLSAPIMATGAARIGEGVGEGDWSNVGWGAAELAGGALGVKMPVPTGRARVPSPAEVTPDAMPVRQPAAPIDVAAQAAPIEAPVLPPEFSPDIRMTQEPVLGGTSPIFDPNSLVGLKRTPEPQFVDPTTGEIRPASQAKPGDVPIIPETPPAPATPPRRAGKRMGAPELGPALPEGAAPKGGGTFIDWLNNLAKEESGEFDVDALGRFIRGEEAPTRRDISENVSRENRNFIDNLPDEALRDYLARFENHPNYARNTVGGDILEYGRQVLDNRTRLAQDVQDLGLENLTPEQASNAIRHYETRGRTDLVDYLTSRYQRTRTSLVAQAGGRTGPSTPSPESYGGIVEQTAGMTTGEVGNFIRNMGDDLYPEDIGPLLREFDRIANPTAGQRAAINYLRQQQEALQSQGVRTEFTSSVRAGSTWQEGRGWSEAPELPVRPSKTLEQVEAGKRTPALERLGKVIGEERAGQLARGERQIEFEEQPYRPQRGKRLPQDTIKSWGEWGDSQVKDAIPDPNKPGMSVEPHNMSSMFPKAFEITYRDAQGNPIGVLHTDLEGSGISTLAVSSKLGLRRGKVAFEMLKEAFDRGVNEPSGSTSDLTKNLIDRVKRLVQSESGEFDADVVINAVNKLIDSISNSRIGQAIGRFARGESGEVDLNRLRALFRKQQEGSITPEEIAEAKTMAQEYQATRQAARQTPKEYLEGKPEVSTGPVEPANVRPGKQVTQDLSQRLKTETGGGAPPSKKPPPLLSADQLDPDVPVTYRKPPEPGIEQSMLSQVWNAPRSLQSVDLPGITSAALRQSRPLSFTADWFRAWNSALKSFGSKEALDAINSKISNSKYFRPRFQPIVNKAGEVIRYVEKPSIAEELGVKMTDVIHHREEAIVSSLAEKIPGYGRYVKASNRAYTGFLNDLRAAKFEQLMDGAKALGRNPEIDTVLGKKLADFVNNATGRGSLQYFGGRINLEPISEVLSAGLYSPRALSARLSFMNPANYTTADPLIRRQYWAGLARIGVSWGAASGLASLLPGVSVSMDPNNSDFGKIRIGNTRIDPGAGFQQLLVLANRELPQVLGGGGTASSTSLPGQPGKFTPFGSSPMAATRLSLVGRYIYNQLNPSLRFVFDLMSASRKEPFDLTDRTLQAVLPMYATDIAEAAKEDATVAEFFAPLLSSMGTGVQTYERGSFGKPQITPFIEQVTGVEVPTVKVGGSKRRSLR